MDLDGGDYPPVTQVTQYGETDFAFVSRLLEDQGIHYRFRFDPDGHTLVLADSSRHAPPMPEREAIDYQGESGAGGADSIHRWGCERNLVATDYAITSFDFQQPREHLVAELAGSRDLGPGLPRLERYEHEGSFAYRDFQEGNRIARLRVEEAELRTKTFFGAGTCRFLVSGHTFELLGHYDPGASVHDRRFLVTRWTTRAATTTGSRTASPSTATPSPACGPGSPSGRPGSPRARRCGVPRPPRWWAQRARRSTATASGG